MKMSGLTAPVRESQPVVVYDGLGYPGRQGSHRHQGVPGGIERWVTPLALAGRQVQQGPLPGQPQV